MELLENQSSSGYSAIENQHSQQQWENRSDLQPRQPCRGNHHHHCRRNPHSIPFSSSPPTSSSSSSPINFAQNIALPPPPLPSLWGTMPPPSPSLLSSTTTYNSCQPHASSRSHYHHHHNNNNNDDNNHTNNRHLAKSATVRLSKHHFLLFILVLVPTFAQALNPLNQYISHYEPLHYDHKPVVASIHRSRRVASQYVAGHPLANPLIEIGFSAHGRNFPLLVKRDVDSSVFHPDLVIEDGNGKPLSVNLDHLVTGHLHGQPNSLVYGSIRDGVFEGKIHATLPSEQVFFVERAHKYFEPEPVLIHLLDSDSRVNRTHSAKFNLYDVVRSVASSQTTTPVITPLTALPFHSVIYNADHVIDPHASKRSTLDGACGAGDKVRQWMDSVANSPAETDNTDSSTNNKNTEQKLEEQINSFFRDHNLHGTKNDHVTAEQKQQNKSQSKQRQAVNRTKRASNNVYHNYRIPGFQEAQGRISYRPTPPPESMPRLPKRRACSLYIQTDTFLWNHMKKHEAIKDDFKVREEIASLVAQHIKAVNHIYETSVFKDIIGLKFIVQRLRINDSSACDSVKREHNQFCSPNIDVSNFLNLNSQFNHNDFCLAYIFTYRDFSGGTLGLAWVASTSGASGGICEKYKTYTENIGGRQVQTKRSLNTGIITFVNYNSRVPPKVSELTLAHEIGHNFGSPHDYPGECRPGGPLGNYIMYSSATSGERQNNNKFSHCSVNNISTVLHAVFNNEGKENCFQEDNGAFCGNKIVEDGEDCDCGYDSRECNEDCCYPRNVDEFKESDPYAQPCKRRPGSYCSPSEGPCCTEKCTFETDMKQCREDGECTYKSFCDGERANCPAPPAKPNKTECNMGTQVCWTGSCTGSICQKYDLEECFLNAKRGSKPDEMCEVACQKRSQPDTCRRTSEIAIMKNVSGMKLRPGSPCNDFQGYCDVFQRCRAVDAEGPLARLKNLLFNKKTLISIKQWVMTYWWLCTLIMFGAILFMAAFIKCCAVHTPSSNPKRKKALRLTDTLRRPADTLRRKSRERSNISSSRQHRSNRDPGHSSSNGGHGHHRQSQSHSASQQQQQQQLPLTNSSASQPSHHQSSHPSEYHHQTATSLLQSASAPPPPLPQPGTGQFPPTLVVNLPPPAIDSHLPQQPFDPPPPYPGIPKPSVAPLNIIASPVNGGPSHGYGEGRGHYNRHGQANVPTSAKPPGPTGKSSSKHKQGDAESSGKSRRS